MDMTGKQLHHIIRLYQFLTNLINGMSYKEAMTYFDDDIRLMCVKAKLNAYVLEEARMHAEDYTTAIHDLKEKYFAENESVIDNEVVNILLEIKTNIFRQSFKEQLLPNIAEPFELCPDKYHKVWVTSDLHFGHENILKYEDRCNKMAVSNIQEHDQKLIDNWNAIVSRNDLVLILGDFSFKKARDTEIILKQLNGKKVLIRGNHDIFLDDKKFDKSLFEAIYDYKEIRYKGQEIALMHYPIQEFKHMDRETKPSVLLFGHIHSLLKVIPRHSFNVGVDVNNYYPVDIVEAIAKALANSGGKVNG